ncbi:MAG TPA: VWA domain-containing protein [Candidatus Sulfotelmatobacter sp.]
MGRISLVLPACLLLSLIPVCGQSADLAKATQPASLPANTLQIRLDVQVTDKSGAPVRGLQKQDFTLLDGKQPLDILSLQAVERPPSGGESAVEVVLVVDAINATQDTVTYERKELRRFLLQNGGKLAQPVAIVFFVGAGALVNSDFSQDGNSLFAKYKDYETGQQNTNLTGTRIPQLAERFDVSVRTFSNLAVSLRKRPGRKLMVWISPGWPLLSGRNLQLSPKAYEGLFESIVKVSTALREADVTVYDVDPLGVANAGGTRLVYYQDFLKGVTGPSKVEPADLALQVLAIQTGGRVLNSSNDLTAEIGKCSSDADSYYILSFNPPPADNANEYHSLALSVNKPGTMARTRTGYYNQP